MDGTSLEQLGGEVAASEAFLWRRILEGSLLCASFVAVPAPGCETIGVIPKDCGSPPAVDESGEGGREVGAPVDDPANSGGGRRW